MESPGAAADTIAEDGRRRPARRRSPSRSRRSRSASASAAITRTIGSPLSVTMISSPRRTRSCHCRRLARYSLVDTVVTTHPPIACTETAYWMYVAVPTWKRSVSGDRPVCDAAAGRLRELPLSALRDPMPWTRADRPRLAWPGCSRGFKTVATGPAGLAGSIPSASADLVYGAGLGARGARTRRVLTAMLTDLCQRRQHGGARSHQAAVERQLRGLCLRGQRPAHGQEATAHRHRRVHGKRPSVSAHGYSPRSTGPKPNQRQPSDDGATPGALPRVNPVRGLPGRTR